MESASHLDQGEMCVWDEVNGGLFVGPFEGKSLSVAFSNDGKYIASGNDDGIISIWNAATGESIHGALEGHTDIVSCIAFSPDSKYIASGSSDKTIRLWNVEKRFMFGETLKGHLHVPFSILFSPNRMHLTEGSSSGMWRAER